MRKEELIEKYEYLNHDCFRRVDTSEVLKDLKQLDEPQKVTVPQFVADWIEVCKEHLPISLYTAMNPNFMKQNNQSADLMSWIEKSSNQEIFAQAWIFGYTVEKENRYLVKVKNMSTRQRVLNRNKKSKDFIFANQEENTLYATKFTRKELEESGFGWVFYCPGIEIEEVEG